MAEQALANRYVQWFDYPGEPTGAAGDLTAICRHWLAALTTTAEEADLLTVRVFQRTREPLAPWLMAQPTLTRLKILTMAAVACHRRNPTKAGLEFSQAS